MIARLSVFLLGLAGAASALAASPLPRPYLCAEGTIAVDLHLSAQAAQLRLGATYLDFQAEGPGLTHFSRTAAPAARMTLTGDSLNLSLPGGALGCAVAPDVPFNARGNEPPWDLSVAGGVAQLRQGYTSALRASGPITDAGADRFTIGDSGLTVALSRRIARDSMSGQPAPYAVSITTPDGVLRGTGGRAGALLTGIDWRVLSVDGASLPMGLAPQITFSDAQITGNAGCNRITGSAELSGEGLHLGPLATTRMACPEPAMALERRVLDALSTVTTYDFKESGDLLLRSGAQTRLQLRPVLLMP